MLRKDLSQLRKGMLWLGVNSDGKLGIQVISYAILIIFLASNVSMYVVFNWDDVGKRLNGLKGIVAYFMCFVNFWAYGPDWNNAIILINTIERGFYKFPYHISEKRIALKQSITNDMLRLNMHWYYVSHIYVTVAIMNGVVMLTIKAIKHGLENISVDTLYLPYPFYYPKNYETVYAYLVALTLEAAFYTQAAMNGYLCTVSSVASMQLIEGELKLLRLSVYEMDRIIGNDCTRHGHTGVDPLEFDIEEAVKKYVDYFVKHQQYIYRKVTDVTKGMHLIAFSVNSGMSMLLCTGIFILVKGENLKHALYESSWIDKSRFYKKSLHLILTRTNRLLEIRSVGLFVLNLSSFLTTVQAAYSYFNVLNNLQN